MCGIHFTVNANPAAANLNGFIKDSFLANQVRGTDSSGMFQVKNYLTPEKTRKVERIKKAWNASEFIDANDVRTMMNSANQSLATVCHVRAATQGTVTDRNAHPFVASRADGSRIIGVHNGSLTNWKHKEGGDQYEVDSEWLYSRIAQDGIAAFDAIEGAFALIWYDSLHPDHIFVARNKDRPLFFGVSEDNKTMIGASELGMLGWLADRNKIKMGKYENGATYVYPEERHVYKINLKDPTDLVKMEMPELKNAPTRYNKKYEPRPIVPGHGPYTNYNRRTPSWDSSQGTVLSAIRAALAQGRLSASINAAKPADVPALPAPKGEDDAPFDTKGSTVDIGSLSQEEQEKIAGFLGITVDLLTLGTPAPVDDPQGFAGAVDKKDWEFLHRPPKGSASTKESDRAKSAGIYGLCVKFSGFLYDEETSDLYGEFRLIEDGQVVKYNAIVRGLSSKAANDGYINSAGLRNMVVIGTATIKTGDWQEPWVVLEERSKAQPQAVYKAPQNIEREKQRVLH